MDQISADPRLVKHVLVINDTREPRDRVENRLRKAAVKNVCAPKSLEYLLNLLDGKVRGSPSRFDLIILDYSLGGWGANLEAVHSKLQGRPITAGVQIVILTAYTEGDGGAKRNKLLCDHDYPIYNDRYSNQRTIDSIVLRFID